MALSFEQKLSLKDGSIVFYHEGDLPSGELFHVLTVIPGLKLEDYFRYIATQENYPISALETFGTILTYDKGTLSDAQIRTLVANRKRENGAV